METQRIFRRFLARRAKGEEVTIDDLVAEHPDREQALRELWKRHRSAERAIEDALPTGPGPSPEEAPLAEEPKLAEAAVAAQHPFEVLRRLARRQGNAWRYKLKGEVARGGMGVVYRVWDEELRRNLAMKVILGRETGTGRGETPEMGTRAVSRFLEEAQVTGQLNHPGIVPLHELGMDEQGRVYFTMSLVQGRSLQQLLPFAHAGTEGWTVTRALSVVLRVCETMAYAHNKGVVHRDLKPSNVLAGRYGAVYVIDWGLAHVLGEPDTKDLRIEGEPPPSVEIVRTERSEATPEPGSPLVTLDGDVVGTPSFMSPEQARGEIEKLGPRSDVYSVGAMLYELLAGRPPYAPAEGRVSPIHVWRFILEGPPAPLDELAAEHPPELIAICEKAMQRDPSGRYADMGEMAEDLRAYLEGRVVRAYRTGPLVELRKWVARNRGTAASLAALLLVATLGGLGLAWVERERAADVLEASDPRRVSGLLDEAWELGPVHPDHAAGREDWLRRAREVAKRVAGYRPQLVELRRRAVEEVRRTEHRNARETADATRLAILEQTREGRPRAIERKTETFADPAADDDAAERAARELEILESDMPRLEAEIARLAPRVERRARGWRFSDPLDQVLHDRLDDMDVDLDRLVEEIARVEGDLEASRTLRARSIDEHREAWDSAIAQVRASDAYAGLELREQTGLVPLGADPASKLQEFWHVPSGERPRRDQEGRLVVEEGTGIVLVLVPEGTFWMGAQGIDPLAPAYDPRATPPEGPPRELDLAAYFVSKYEMTQAQWFRASGTDPSAVPAGCDFGRAGTISWSHPVEQVTHRESRRALSRWGLRLPTEAQWERAARGGMEDAYLHGPEVSSLVGRVNAVGDVQDPYYRHAPVDALDPNAFGLFGVSGNVDEWCRDWMDTTGKYPGGAAGPDGELLPERPYARTVRGGGFRTPLEGMRLAQRMNERPDGARQDLGLRPVRALERAPVKPPE